MPASPDYSQVWGADPEDLIVDQPTQEELEENEAAHQWLLALEAAAVEAVDPEFETPAQTEERELVEDEANTEEAPTAE